MQLSIKCFNCLLILISLLLIGSCGSPLNQNMDQQPTEQIPNHLAPAILWPDGKKYLGSGVDILTNVTIGMPFTDSTLTVYYQEGTKTTSEVQRYIRSYEELNDMFNFSGSIGVSLPFGIKFGAKGAIIENVKTNATSVLYVFKSQYTSCEGFIGSWTLTQQAQTLKQTNPALFQKTYGSGYLSKIVLGSRLSIIFQLSNVDYSKTNEKSLSGYLEAMIGAININGELDYKAALNEIKQYCSISVYIDAIGFVPGTYNIEDPKSLFDIVNKYHDYVTNLEKNKNYGVLEYMNGSYEIQNADPRLDRSFITYNRWFYLQQKIKSIRSQNYNSEINNACDNALLMISQRLSDCYDLTKDPFIQPSANEFANIDELLENLFKKDLYFLKDGNREFFMATDMANYAADLSKLRTYVNANLTLPADQYTFKVYTIPVKNAIPIYQCISGNVKSSGFFTIDPLKYNIMITNYAWQPFMGQYILGWVKNTVANSDPSFLSFNNHIDQPIYVDCVAQLTANGSGYGHLAACSSTYDSTKYDAWRAFDGNDVSMSCSRWISNSSASFPQWITYDIGGIPVSPTPNEYKPAYIRSYYILPEFGGCSDRAPKNWILQGLKGNTWETIDTRSNMIINGSNGTGWKSSSGVLAGKTFTITSTIKPYSKYRLYVTAVNGSPVVSIRQIKLFY